MPWQFRGCSEAGWVIWKAAPEPNPDITGQAMAFSASLSLAAKIPVLQLVSVGTFWRLKACSGSITEGCGSWCTHKTSKGYWWNSAFTDFKSKIVTDIHRAMTSISGCWIHLDMFPSMFHVWRSHVSFVRNEPRDIIISSLNLQLLCVLFTAFNAHIPAQSSVSRIKSLLTRTVLGQRLK